MLSLEKLCPTQILFFLYYSFCFLSCFFLSFLISYHLQLRNLGVHLFIVRLPHEDQDLDCQLCSYIPQYLALCLVLIWFQIDVCWMNEWVVTIDQSRDRKLPTPILPSSSRADTVPFISGNTTNCNPHEAKNHNKYWLVELCWHVGAGSWIPPAWAACYNIKLLGGALWVRFLQIDSVQGGEWVSLSTCKSPIYLHLLC